MGDFPGRRFAARAVLPAACTLVLAAACGGPAGPAASPGTQHGAAHGPQAGHMHAAAARYLAIAGPANAQLEHDFDGLTGRDRGDLAALAADLRAAAGTERRFDRQLTRLGLPAPAATSARLLIAANESRARLAERAGRSRSLAQLRGYEHRLTAANAQVEAPVRVIRSALGLPPPDAS